MNDRGNKRVLLGKVTSDSMDKTVTVLVERLVKHNLYKKYVKKHKKYAAHDEKNSCNVGDKVLITETRPLSKMKRFRVTKIVEKAV